MPEAQQHTRRRALRRGGGKYGSFTDDRDEEHDEDDDDKMEEYNHDTDTADHDDASEENNVYNDSATRRILWTTVLHATGSLDSTDGRDDPNQTNPIDRHSTPITPTPRDSVVPIRRTTAINFVG